MITNNSGTAKSNSKLLRGYAPAEMNLLSAWIYSTVRLIYLLSTGAVLPLSIIYAKGGSSSLFIYPWIGWVLAFGAMIWTLMYIGLEQYSYPVKLSGAAAVTAGMLSNGWSGYTISGLNIFYGAYQVVMSALCAQFLFISWITARYLYMKAKDTEEGRDMKWWYIAFLFSISVSLGVLLLSLSGPVISVFADEKNFILLGASILFFSYQAFSDGVVLWKGSIFNKYVMAFELRNQLHEKWAAFSALTIISALLASIVIGLWNV